MANNNTAREWVINGYSGYKGLVLQDCDVKEAGPGEVRLRIEAFALNWGDADLMLDNYSFSFPTFPARIGMEACGVIDQIGEGVTGINIGERYCTLPYFYFNSGASADSVVIKPEYITKAPKGLSPVEAASVWMQYLTAYFPLTEHIQAGPGKNVLVLAGTSTAGNASIEIGKLLGANMIGTTRYERNRDYLLKSGANHVFVDDGSRNIVEDLMSFTDGNGVDMSFDPIGKDMMMRYGPALARDAKLVMYGWLSGIAPETPILDMIVKNASYHPYSLFNYIENTRLRDKGVKFLYDALSSGQLSPTIDKVFPMEGYIEAWDYLKAERTSHGKVVIDVTGTAMQK